MRSKLEASAAKYFLRVCKLLEKELVGTIMPIKCYFITIVYGMHFKIALLMFLEKIKELI